MSDSLYALVGGDTAVRALVDRFYTHMDTLPEAGGIRALHAPDLAEARDKLYWFLSGWLGGPPLYIERRGHPRLRARHLPFAIGPDERDQWMLCMTLALEETVPRADVRDTVSQALGSLATHMINQE